MFGTTRAYKSVWMLGRSMARDDAKTHFESGMPWLSVGVIWSKFETIYWHFSRVSLGASVCMLKGAATVNSQICCSENLVLMWRRDVILH